MIDGFADNTGAVNGLKDGWNDATAAKPLLVQDVDNDGLPAFLDLDSDNDGLTDILEAGGIDRDTDGNGLVDNFTDVDNDGLADIILYNPYINPDSDNDGRRNFLDLDSDNDGIVDAIESGRQVDSRGRLLNAIANDANGNGLSDEIEANPVTADIDTDGDGYANYVDIDSDNDAILDIYEGQPSGASFRLHANLDTDGDGLDDAYDPDNGGTLVTLVNSDTDTIPDYIDTDSDNDGVLDIIEGSDANSNGIPDWDSNGNFDFTDEAGGATDNDDKDGLLDVFVLSRRRHKATSTPVQVLHLCKILTATTCPTGETTTMTTTVF